MRKKPQKDEFSILDVNRLLDFEKGLLNYFLVLTKLLLGYLMLLKFKLIHVHSINV